MRLIVHLLLFIPINMLLNRRFYFNIQKSLRVIHNFDGAIGRRSSSTLSSSKESLGIEGMKRNEYLFGSNPKSFRQLGIDDLICDALESMDRSLPTIIQAKVIPRILTNQDVCNEFPQLPLSLFL